MEEFEYDKNWESLAGSQPILGNYDDALKALARSARESSLRRFCPFTSMACLCLSESCWPWKLWQVQPGHIVFSSGGQFCVCTGSPYQKGSIVAWTRDPDEAVRELVGVLERYTAMKRLWRRVWAGPGREAVQPGRVEALQPMTARLNRSGRNLDDELGEYLLWLEPTLAKVGLTWEEVVVAERDESTAWRDYVSGDGASFDLPRGRAVAPADFAARFRAILNEAARGWVNLTADTIKDGRLIVVVEWCSEPKRVGSEPSRPIWVNWSGLSFQEAARLAALRK